MQSMTLGEGLIQGAVEGRIHAAIWHGRHDLSPGPIRLEAPDGGAAVEMTVTEVRHKPFAELDDREARDSGEPDREALWHVMSGHYAGMTRTDDVTVALLS